MISPSKNFNKIVKVIKSCETHDQLDVANNCIDIFLSQRAAYLEYYKINKFEKPIAVRGNKYDHDMAAWMLIKLLNRKKKQVK